MNIRMCCACDKAQTQYWVCKGCERQWTDSGLGLRDFINRERHRLGRPQSDEGWDQLTGARK